MKHYDKPAHQRWLYILSDLGLFKAILVIWLVCWLTIGASLAMVKALISVFK